MWTGSRCKKLRNKRNPCRYICASRGEKDPVVHRLRSCHAPWYVLRRRRKPVSANLLQLFTATHFRGAITCAHQNCSQDKWDPRVSRALCRYRSRPSLCHQPQSQSRCRVGPMDDCPFLIERRTDITESEFRIHKKRRCDAHQPHARNAV